MDESDEFWWRHGIFYQIYPRSFQDSNADGVGGLVGKGSLGFPLVACPGAKPVSTFAGGVLCFAVMESPIRQINLVPAPDRRQSETALAIARGTARLLRSLGFACISELPLPSGRRADLVALNERGEIWIVEIKSSIADFRADQKWQDYRAHCDRLFFATTVEVPCDIFPPDTGLIVADAFGAEFKCEAPEHKLPAATRKSMMLLFARAAA